METTKKARKHAVALQTSDLSAGIKIVNGEVKHIYIKKNLKETMRQQPLAMKI
jgi:hypothetical protein